MPRSLGRVLSRCMSGRREPTGYRASIHALSLVLLGAVLGLPARGYGQEAAPSEDYQLKYVEPESVSREPSREERLDQLRRCQVCDRDGVGFRFSIPIFVPLAAFRASGDGDENDDGMEDSTPQLLDLPRIVL